MLRHRCRIVASTLAYQLAELIVASRHVWMVLDDVLARQAKKGLVIRTAKLMATGTLDDPAHVNLHPRGGFQIEETAMRD